MKKFLLTLFVLILMLATAHAAKSGSLQSLILTAERGDEKALSTLLAKGDKGDADAQVALGEVYYHGIRPQRAPLALVEFDYFHYVSGLAKDSDEAMKWFRKAAAQGNAVAQERIGAMYLKGKGITQSTSEGFTWLTKSAEQGNADAQYRVGEMYWKVNIGNDFKANQKTAMKWLTAAAKQGNPEAETLIGRTFEDGRGFGKDYAQAITWFTKAAEDGNLEALSNLAKIYRDGLGVPQDKVKAYMWSVLAAANGDQANARSQIALNMPQEDIVKARELAITWQAAHVPHQPSPLSETNLYYGYDFSTPFSREIEDLRSAALKGKGDTLETLKSLARKGNIEAQLELGGLYSDYLANYPVVWSVDVDLPEALQWFRSAADQGNAQAMWWMARIYNSHDYKGKDDAEAFKWYEDAAKRNYPPAEEMVGLHYERGSIVPTDFSKALQWINRAANHGDSVAQIHLSKAYEAGTIGLKPDNEQAYFWQLVAAVKCDPGNGNLPIDFVERTLTQGQITHAWKQMREWKPIPYWTTKN